MLQHDDGGLDNGPVQETRKISKYSTLELLELGKKFKQAMKKTLTTLLVKLWDMGADGTILSSAEAEKLSNVMIHPSLR